MQQQPIFEKIAFEARSTCKNFAHKEMPYFKPKNLSTITTSNVPKYVINLDLAPEDRWTQVIADFKPQFPKVVAWVDEILQALLGSVC